MTGTRKAQVERLGNAVPPRFAQAIAETIRDGILGKAEFTYISTFAGCGGSSLGYKWAGGKGLLAIEFDANAAATYRANFETPVLERDICTVTADEVLKLTGLKVGELDVLDGSPPCQGFSTAGKRVLHDPRNSLFREFVRLIEGLQPKVFVMENVSGMVKGKMKYVFAEVMRCLKATGYTVRCQLLNAMYFNVPQSRERLIWIGVRSDLQRPPEFPKAQGKPVTVREAWKGLTVDPTGLELTPRYSAYWRAAKPGESVGKLNTVRKLEWGRPAYMMQKSEGNGGLYHPSECRRLHLSEFKRLASFPDSFKFIGVAKNAWARMGNSVPPRFMQAIAECIRDTILIPAAPAGVSE